MTADTERTLAETLDQLNSLQLAFVKARAITRFDRQAAEIAQCHEKTPIRWRQKGIPIDEAVRLLRLSAVQDARDQLCAAASEAVGVLLDEIRTDGPERVRAALAVLDRVGLPATSRVEGEIEAAGVMIVLDDGQAADGSAS